MKNVMKSFLKSILPKQLLSLGRKYLSDREMIHWKKYRLEDEHTSGARIVANRSALLKYLPKGGVVAELGVDKGLFSQQIIESCKPEKLHLVDVWASERFNEQKASNVSRIFKKQIDNGSVILNRKLSTEVVSEFDDFYFDWIYIDTDHTYENTLLELKVFAKKIKIGGYIAGHDYSMGNWLTGAKFGVIEAVSEFCVTEGWKLVFLTADYTENQSFVITRIVED